jgi:hypothetical protein
MNFLPIAERELRVAARKRGIFWTRQMAALLTLVVAGLLLFMFRASGFMPNKGQVMFGVLAWLAFIYAFAAGVFLTSDCLSEEKREGTLGLLFLTDLRGYDVILGKLASTSLHAFYGLIAVFPIISLSLLLGGLLAEQFWKSIFAITNMLLFSLAVGILASCISREPLRSMNTAILFLLVLIGLPYAIDFALADWQAPRFVPRASLLAPLQPFLAAQAGGRWPFWSSLMMSHLVAWGCLALAAWRIRHTWQDQRMAEHRKKGAVQRQQERIEARKRSSDPVLWLASRARRFRLWLLLVVLAATLMIGLAGNSRRSALYLVQMVLNGFGLLLYVWMTAHSTRFFVEGMRNGAFELMLCTPVREHEIVRAEWRSFVRTFALPLLLLITGEQLVGFTQLLHSGTLDSYLVANAISGAITSLTTSISIAWFGMWMGLRSRKAHVAIIKTLVFVFVLPLIAIGILQVALTFTIGLRWGLPQWLTPVVVCALCVAKDVAFTVWARRQLYTRFREAVAGIERPAAGIHALPVPVVLGREATS